MFTPNVGFMSDAMNIADARLGWGTSPRRPIVPIYAEACPTDNIRAEYPALDVCMGFGCVHLCGSTFLRHHNRLTHTHALKHQVSVGLAAGAVSPVFTCGTYAVRVACGMWEGRNKM